MGILSFQMVKWPRPKMAFLRAIFSGRLSGGFRAYNRAELEVVVVPGQSLVDFAANDWIEPFLRDAAPRSNGRNVKQSGR